MKSAPIRGIQREYFQLLRKHLAAEQQGFSESGLDAPEYCSRLFKSDTASELILPGTSGKYISPLSYRIRALLTDIAEFWKQHSAAMVQWIEQSTALCLSYNAPYVDLEKVASFRRLGLYFDTLCVTDPLFLPTESWRANQIALTDAPMESGYLIWFFLLLRLEPLFLADCDPPLAVLYPSLLSLHLKDDLQAELRAQEVAFDTTRKLLGIDRKVSSWDDFIEVTKTVPEESALRILRTDPMFQGHSIKDILSLGLGMLFEASGYARETRAVFESMPRNLKLVWGIQTFVSRSLYPILHSENECSHLPLARYVRDRKQWAILKTLLQRSASESAESLGLTPEDAAVFAFENPDLQWLSNVSVAELIRLRELGFMEEMRDFFRVNTAALRRASVKESGAVLQQISARFDDRLNAHAKELKRREAEYRRSLKLSAASLVVTAGLGVASVALPAMLPVAIGSAIYSATIGSKSAKDLIEQWSEHKKTDAQLKNRPIAFLFEMYQRAKDGTDSTEA